MTTQERIQELRRLEDFFKTAPQPAATISLDGYMRLNNIQTFVGTNIIRANIDIDNARSEACILRLQQLEQHMLGTVAS